MTTQEAFVRENTAPVTPSLVPELQLCLASETCPVWLQTPEHFSKLGIPEPFWAFAWAGGQALARYIFDNPEIVYGQTILDFGSGSGIVAIAAAKSGAAHVVASDIDEYAKAAIAINAKRNNVDIEITRENFIGIDKNWTTVFAADVCYEKNMSLIINTWLKSLASSGSKVFIGDPQRIYLPKDGLERIKKYSRKTGSRLEDTDLQNAQVWRVV